MAGMTGISKHKTISLTEISGAASAGHSTLSRCNCHPNLIGSLNDSIFRRLLVASLILASGTAAASDSSFPHVLTPVTTSSPETTFSNDSTNLAIIIASIAAASLFILTVTTLLFLKWRRQGSIFRLDGGQDFEALLTTEPAAPPLIPSAILQRTTNNPTAYPSANRNLFGFGFGERATESSQVLGPRRTL